MYIRASFVLIGSTLSGVVAFFIFSLQENSKQREKKENEITHYENIKEEFEENLLIFKKLSRMTTKYSVEGLATAIADEKEMKEVMLALFTQLNFTFYSDFLKELKNKEYNEHKKAFKSAYQTYKYLELIIDKLENSDTIRKILSLIDEELFDMHILYSGTVTKVEEVLADANSGNL